MNMLNNSLCEFANGRGLIFLTSGRCCFLFANERAIELIVRVVERVMQSDIFQ